MKTFFGIFLVVYLTLPLTVPAEELNNLAMVFTEGKSYVIVVGVRFSKHVKEVKRKSIESTLMEKFELKHSSTPSRDQAYMCTFKARNAREKWFLKQRIRGFDLRHSGFSIHISKYAKMYF